MTKSLAEAAKEIDAAAGEVRDATPRSSRCIDLGSRLEGLTRHASARTPPASSSRRGRSTSYVPLYKVTKGDEEQIMTQWDMNVIEKVGLLKMDFLGLRTLTVIDDAVKIIAPAGDRRRPRRDPARRPRDLPHLLRGAHQRHLPVRVARHDATCCGGSSRPRFEDLAALNALYRPGPLGRHGRGVHPAQARAKKVTYLLPETQADPGGDLRRHRLPGAGDADRRRRSPASPWPRPTCCARRWARRRPT